MLYLARSNKEDRMKNCYYLFQKYNWDLKKFKNNTDLLMEEVRANAREYALNVLENPLSKEQIWCLMPRSIRLLFNDYDNIIKQMLVDKIITQQQLIDIEWIIANLRNRLCEYCFNIGEQLKWINDDIHKYCDNYNISYASLSNLAREYTLNVLQWDDGQLEKHRTKKESYRRIYNLNNNLDGIFSNFFANLLKIHDNNEVIKKFVEFNKQYFELNHNLKNFLSTYHIPDELREDLFKKLQLYQEYLTLNKNQVKEEQKIKDQNQHVKENLDDAVSIINNFINGKYENIDTYCLNIKLDKPLFDKYLELVRQNDKQLYTKYLQHIESNKNKFYEKLLSGALIVIDLMKNGVEENGVKREFDLVDYYRYLPLGFDRVMRMVRDDINPDDYRLLSAYVGKHKYEQELSEVGIDNIYNMKTIVNVQFDEENKAIPGTGREITVVEKQNIINYLRSNNIPLTTKTYNIIYKRWLSGNLVLEEQTKKLNKI